MKKEYKELKEELLKRENIMSVKKIGKDKIRVEIDQAYGGYLNLYDVLIDEENRNTEIGMTVEMVDIWDEKKETYKRCRKFGNAYLIAIWAERFNTTVYSVDFRIISYLEDTDEEFIDEFEDVDNIAEEMMAEECAKYGMTFDEEIRFNSPKGKTTLKDVSKDTLLNEVDGNVLTREELKELEKNDNVIWFYHTQGSDNVYPQDEYLCTCLDLEYGEGDLDDISIYVYTEVESFFRSASGEELYKEICRRDGLLTRYELKELSKNDNVMRCSKTHLPLKKYSREQYARDKYNCFSIHLNKKDDYILYVYVEK